MEDINLTLVSIDPKLTTNYIESKYFANYTEKKKEIVTEAYPFFNHQNIYEIHVHTFLNSDEQSNVITLLKNLLSHEVVTCDSKRFMIVKCLGKMPSKVALFLKESTEKYFNTTSFIFACRSISHLPKYLMNTSLVIRIPAQNTLFKKTMLDTLIEQFFKGNIKLRDVCLRLSASGISFAEISKSTVNLFADLSHETMDIYKIVNIVAEMEHKSHIVNKDLFVLENYLNILYTEWQMQNQTLSKMLNLEIS